MKGLLTTIGFLLWLALPASAQGTCLPLGPGNTPVSYQQWYGVCGPQVVQMCQYMSNITPVPAANCNNILAASYQQYVIAVRTVGGQPQCSQYNAGQQACLAGYVATCNGYLWQRSGTPCS